MVVVHELLCNCDGLLCCYVSCCIVMSVVAELLGVHRHKKNKENEQSLFLGTCEVWFQRGNCNAWRVSDGKENDKERTEEEMDG